MISTAKYAVHLASEEDIPRLVFLAEAFHEASFAHHRDYSSVADPVQWIVWWSAAVQSGAAIVLFCTEDGSRGGRPVGMICAIIAESIVDRVIEVTEAIWYVSSAGRKMACGMGLLDGLEIAAARIGAKRVHMTHLADGTGDRLSRILRRWGYAPVEIAYSKRIGGA